MNLCIFAAGPTPARVKAPVPSAHLMGTIGFADFVYPRLPIFIDHRSNLHFCGRASTGLGPGPSAHLMGTIGFADIGYPKLPIFIEHR